VDPQSLQQILVNLLLNGIEAVTTGAGPSDQSPSIESPPTESPRRVGLSIERTGSSAVVSVRDTGAGPDANIAGTMFQPLISDKADGAGLGLAVAREIAEHHGGRLTWKRVDEETSFELELPLAPVRTAHGALVDR
jgi:C4-dicarboxylate-specific signal transduction histidine kinase